jgi:hypothetical protein
MATPPLLEETRCVTILFVDKQHSRFEVHQIKNLLDAMEHEPGSKAKFKKATRKPLREHFRRSPWNGIFDRRHHPTSRIAKRHRQLEEDYVNERKKLKRTCTSRSSDSEVVNLSSDDHSSKKEDISDSSDEEDTPVKDVRKT